MQHKYHNINRPERLLEAAESFEKKYQATEKKLVAAEASSRHAHKKLTSLEQEKSTLQNEYEQVKALAEELMQMVEGQGTHEF